MTLTPTPEQSSIIEAAVNTTDNLLIQAFAGAAKTSTLELICKALPTDKPVLSLAFNKRIADEMAKRLPSNVVAKTLNSIGHGVWSAAVGKRLTVDTKKSFDLLQNVLNRRKKKRWDIDFGETLKAIGTAKMNGYLPRGKYPGVESLIDEADFASMFEEDIDLDIVDEVLFHSIQMAYDGKIDFDDQIFMPTLFGGTFPRFPLIMVDEAQDLSSLNHHFIDKLVNLRIIAVGDKLQSIYAFRGADSSSMARLRHKYSMVEFPLSISFRCPISIIERARFRAPSMQWPTWAKVGTVAELQDWWPEENSAIICRNNAPLFKCAMELIKLGRGVKLVGTDLGPNLVKAMKKLGSETLSRVQFLQTIDDWEAERLRKNKSKADSIADKADCFRVFAEYGETLGSAIAYAEHLFAQGGTVQLMSGHKSKGLEFEIVYHLDPWRVPSKWAKESPAAMDQELNLKYVILTRSKDSYFEVLIENLRKPTSLLDQPAETIEVGKNEPQLIESVEA